MMRLAVNLQPQRFLPLAWPSACLAAGGLQAAGFSQRVSDDCIPFLARRAQNLDLGGHRIANLTWVQRLANCHARTQKDLEQQLQEQHNEPGTD